MPNLSQCAKQGNQISRNPHQKSKRFILLAWATGAALFLCSCGMSNKDKELARDWLKISGIDSQLIFRYDPNISSIKLVLERHINASLRLRDKCRSDKELTKLANRVLQTTSVTLYYVALCQNDETSKDYAMSVYKEATLRFSPKKASLGPEDWKIEIESSFDSDYFRIKHTVWNSIDADIQKQIQQTKNAEKTYDAMD